MLYQQLPHSFCLKIASALLPIKNDSTYDPTNITIVRMIGRSRYMLSAYMSAHRRRIDILLLKFIFELGCLGYAPRLVLRIEPHQASLSPPAACLALIGRPCAYLGDTVALILLFLGLPNSGQPDVFGVSS